MAGNRLNQATSPYLLQHAENPVHWQAWGPEALAEASAENKPILLSVGYAACHWCHVMAHESFEDAETAALMNRHFVNIKVDREERPDLDQIYMSALHAMGEQGGWPLTMFLTPEGEPFWGGTYFPPSPRWGRPSFRQVLAAIADAWKNDRARLAEGAGALIRRVAAQGAAKSGAAITPADLDAAFSRLLAQVDWRQGGLQGAPKFPNPPIFRFFWQEYCRAGRAEGRDAVRLLLERMSQGGIYDHLGGGFSRYSTDAEWLVPHFEKMLYDNALILELLAFAHADAPDALFAARARETVGWLLRDMEAGEDKDAEGNAAFAASEDADSEGEEGKFYVWSRSELEAALGEDVEFFARHYDCPAEGNWEGRIILRRLTPLSDEGTESRLASLRERLFAIRARRVRPGRDDKILADWNGLAIAALVRAAAVFAEPSCLDRAESAFASIRNLLAAEDGRSHHAYRRGTVSASGMLDDQAAMIRAALALHEATGRNHYLDEARRILAATETHFSDGEGGFYLTADDAADLPPAAARPRSSYDGVTPSGAAMMAEVYARLHHLTGEAAFRARAEAAITRMTGNRAALPALPTLLGAAALLDQATSIVILGNPADPGFTALHRAALSAPDPLAVILPVGDASNLPSGHPAQGKTAGQPSAFLCRNNVCSLPVTDEAALRDALRSVSRET
ncbi:MAG TPA: thioredoxin domain-containing protein [Acetobacteraceae bacterium]|nr:thioredoxin domain-containing protein [Acetobacteraceae bacterium]